jgi:carbamoyl-phosphate synthase small subunit
VTAISKVDTRTLAVHLRQKGQMQGIISARDFEPKSLLAKINALRKEKERSLLPEISVGKPQQLGAKKARYKIAVLDLGITQSAIKQLEALGAGLTLLPYDARPQEILRLKPRGLIISSGPEEDIALEEVAANVKPLVGKLPILGISAGHQVLARALGAKVFKMKLGHRGVNYPLSRPASFKGEITVQNHSCAVDADSLGKAKAVKITGYNLNDRTVEEIESKKLKIIGVQYVPASPGFGEVNSVFKKFMKIL